MAEARAEQLTANEWSGGTLPYRVGHRKLGMWLFIVSDSLTFSALLFGYAYVRASNVWPTPFPFSPSIVFSTIMTLCLLSSSLTMVMGVSASARGDLKAVRKWILLTILFGLTFIVLHLIEWKHLIDEGLRPFFRKWLLPFAQLKVGETTYTASTVTAANAGGSDFLSFDAAGLNGFDFLQDDMEYETRTWHSSQDTYDRLVEDDLKEAACVVAAFVYNAAMMDERIPRKPMQFR